MKEDWIECTIPDLISNDGVFIDGDWVEKKDQDVNGKIRLIQLSDIGDGFFKNKSNVFINEQTSQKLNVTFLEKDDILIARMPEPLGRATIFPLEGYKQYITAVDIAIIRFKNNYISPTFFTYIINAPQFRIEISKLEGGTTRKRISRKNLSIISFPLAPTPIQRATVKKIEQLFSALDAGVADLRRAREQLKLYRHAVLKKAFEGIEDSTPLSNAGVWKGGGTPSTQNKEFWDKGHIPWVSSQDVKSMFIYDTERKITEAAIQGSSTKWIDTGALIFVVRSGILRRIFPIAIAKVDLCVNQDIQTLTLFDEFDPEFLYWFLTANEYDIRQTCSKDGTTVESIDVFKLKKYHIPLCSKSHQQKIIKDIRSRLSKCDAVEHQISISLQQSEALRQSILKKAFSGELLTYAELKACKSQPDYEPASFLMERIRDVKNISKTKKQEKSAYPQTKPVIVSPVKVSTDIHGGLLSKIIKLHEANPKYRDKLTHVKCEKISHLIEYHVQIPLGRTPVKDAAGPDDYPHLKKVESRARKAGFFKIKKTKIGYSYVSGNNIDKVINKFESSLSVEQNKKVDALLQLFLHFDLEQAEIVATAYAAWNNLIILGNQKPSDDEIVTESRENWSKRKLLIKRERFYNAIKWMRKKEINLIPTGYGLLVSAPVKNKK
jgi:type I restriction enzyme, S subunit